MPAVSEEPMLALGALEQIADLMGDTAGGLVAARMQQLDAVQADLGEHPGRGGAQGTWRDLTPSSHRQNPVRGLG